MMSGKAPMFVCAVGALTIAAQTIPPHGTLAFDFYRTGPPLPHRTGGRFDTTVKVIDFAEIGPHASR